MSEESLRKHTKSEKSFPGNPRYIADACKECGTKWDMVHQDYAALQAALASREGALFQRGNFTLHSGQESTWKIECDSLTDEDWETLAAMIAEKQKFSHVIGVPRGGIKLAQALVKYCSPGKNYPRLVVDDVLTTGNSLKEVMSLEPVKPVGWVVFARGPLPEGVHALFQMGDDYERLRAIAARVEAAIADYEKRKTLTAPDIARVYIQPELDMLRSLLGHSDAKGV